MMILGQAGGFSLLKAVLPATARGNRRWTNKVKQLAPSTRSKPSCGFVLNNPGLEPWFEALQIRI